MDDLTVTLLIVLALVGGIRLGWVARERHAKKLLESLAVQIEESIEHQLEEDTIAITIDKHEDGYFVYRMDDQMFLAQGSTRHELEKRLATSYPEKQFVATYDNLHEVGFDK